jgi:hypothetical protein
MAAFNELIRLHDWTGFELFVVWIASLLLLYACGGVTHALRRRWTRFQQRRRCRRVLEGARDARYSDPAFRTHAGAGRGLDGAVMGWPAPVSHDATLSSGTSTGDVASSGRRLSGSSSGLDCNSESYGRSTSLIAPLGATRVKRNGNGAA